MFEFLLALALLIQAPEAVKLQGGVVTGMLRTNNGAPMAGVRVAVLPADGTDPGIALLGIAQTDSNGRYRIENVPPGRYHIMTGRIDSPLFHPGVDDIRIATTIVVTDGSTTPVADMLFVRTRVTGRVVEAATGIGRRIESLSICCEYSPYSSSIASRSAAIGAGVIEVSLAPLTTRVNDDGSFEFSAVPAGNQYLQVFDPKIVSYNLPITITRTDLNGIEVKVSNESGIRGSVVDRIGRPVGGVSISLQPQDGNGVYELRGRPLEGSAIMSGSALPSGMSPLSPSSTDILSRLQGQAGSRVIPIGPGGLFDFTGVIPGAYVMEIRSAGGYSVRREIKVGREYADVHVEMPFTQLSGRVVVDGGGTPPALKDSVRIFMYAPDGRAFFTLPDSAGRFYQLLNPGEYRFTADSLTTNYSVVSISDGSRDLLTQPLVFDGVTLQEIQITLNVTP